MEDEGYHPESGTTPTSDTEDANRMRTPGAVAREFFLEYDPGEMPCPTLLEHGFVHSAPVRIEGGHETWRVCYAGDRGAIETALDRVREAGYYRWPREASTRELADGLDVSKTTLLEHLRKAETKLLAPERS